MSILTEDQAAAISKLVRKFQRLTKADIRKYQEAEVRTNFIDPLFSVLGWAMDDRAHVERETMVEQGKHPDYIFKLYAVPRLFLEAKAFREDARSFEYARDAISKAYNKGVPWAAVTNFTDLVVYDAYEVKSGKEPLRVLDLTLDDYVRADSGLHLVSRKGLEDRLLSQRAVETGVRRRPVRIEKRLYESMRSWRETLFNDMYYLLGWRTDEQVRQGDEAVQRLIDRLIFLRNCEDRGISVPYLRQLRHKIRERSQRPIFITDLLTDLFEDAASTYDSEIFEPGAPVDVLLQRLAGGTALDQTLSEIIEGLYSVPESHAEYDFEKMEPDVLGQVYEQYLGHVPQRVRKRAAQRPLPGMPAKEIAVTRRGRKEHGIYYTPHWVVDYIVQNTLGRFLEENEDRPKAIDNVTVLDPACGSGSFLIRAYETLLRHHANRRGVAVEKLSRRLREGILRRNIFGVDMDPQALEIARLNLLIRMVRKQELLPELKDNIRLGNSLISGTEEDLRSYFGKDWRERHPFNWEVEFPAVFEKGGFDVVIGNPPYIKEYVNREPFFELRGSTLAKYYEGKSDIWYAFACLAVDLLKEGGLHSFIATNNWITSSGANNLREKILAETRLVRCVDFRDYPVFEGVGIQTMIYVLQKTGTTHSGKVRYSAITRKDITESEVVSLLLDDETGDYAVSFDAALDARKPGAPFTFVDESDDEILDQIEAKGQYRLGADDVAQGIVTPQDSVIKKHLAKLKNTAVSSGDGIFILPDKQKRALGLPAKERKALKPFYTTAELRRYFGSRENRSWIIYADPKFVSTIAAYPTLKAHLGKFAKIMTSSNKPYGLHRARDERFFVGEKLVALRKTDVPHFTYTDFPCYVSQTFNILRPTDINLKYLLAILNSKVGHFWFHKRGKRQGKALQVDQAPLLQFPIREIDPNNPTEVKMQDGLVSLVDGLLEHHQRISSTKGLHSSELEQANRAIAATEQQIEKRVFDLYDLSTTQREQIEAALVTRQDEG